MAKIELIVPDIGDFHDAAFDAAVIPSVAYLDPEIAWGA